MVDLTPIPLAEASKRTLSSGRKVFTSDRARELRAERRITKAASENRMVTLRYSKLTTGEYVRRTVEPYSWRLGPMAGDSRDWVWLYAYHPEHNTIESYLFRHIRDVKILERSFVPRWKVEIG